MEITTFWRIIIKGIGLWLLINSVYIIPQLTATLSFGIDGELAWGNLISVWILTLGNLVLYLLPTYFFLFKTDWIVEKLKLDQNFTEKRIDVNIPYRTVLSIIIILIGAIIFVEGIPKLCSTIYEFMKQKELIDSYIGTSWIVFYFLKTLFGYLIMTNSKMIIKFIDKEKINETKE